MEANRKAYSEDSQNHIRRQRQIIDKLKADNANLKSELVVDQQDSGAPPPLSVQNEIVRLGDFADMYTRKIEMERRRVEELDEHLALSDAKIFEQKKAMGGVNAPADDDNRVHMSVTVLEKKVDRTLMNFNEALAKNKALRETIDNLRREKIGFEAVYRKLEKELQEKKREMASVIDTSNISYEARDQAQNEIAAIRAQGDKEAAAFDVEWRELGKILEHDRKMKELAMRNKLKAAELGLSLAEASDEKLNKKSLRGKKEITEMAKKVETYEEAFTKIQAATGITDIDDLVTSFIAAEDQNFSLFNFVNELNQEQEKLEEQVQELQAEIRKFRGNGPDDDGQRKKILKELEQKLERTDASTASYEKRFQRVTSIVRALGAGVSSIYHKIGCDTPENREYLGDDGVKEDNMLMYLGIIEQRANEIIAAYVAKLSASGGGGRYGGKIVARPTGPPTPPKGAIAGVSIDPPTTAPDDYGRDDESEEEVDDRPLTREELQEKTLRSLSKRESQGGAGGAGAKKRGAKKR
jgi:coiled-coil domain-containing protein 63/114|eukprot:31387-Pelagococcus_subviridis.AAC.3